VVAYGGEFACVCLGLRVCVCLCVITRLAVFAYVCVRLPVFAFVVGVSASV